MIILGGAGYIGSYLADHFGADVDDPGWYGPAHRAASSRFTHDVIIDLAAYSALRNCDLDPEGAWRVNVERFRHLLTTLRPGQVLVYASSASVYAPGPYPSSEDDPVHPVRMYDLTKVVDDALAQMAIAHGKTVIGLRFGTLAGLSPHTRTDLVVNSMTWDAITDGEVRVANADSRRTLLFLPDLANALENVLSRPQAGVYNLGSTHTTIGEIARDVARQTGAHIIPMEDENPYSFRISSDKFLATFGEYRTADLSTIVADLADGLPTVHRSRRDYLP